MIKHSTLDLDDVNIYPKLIFDYLRNNLPKDILPYQGYDIENFEAIIKAKKSNYLYRNELITALKNQYIGEEENVLVSKNIARLQHSDTFCVTTAHQLNIFSGPLYVIYKIISAIKLAKELKSKYPTKDFLAIYVLGSEDHDLAEINNFSIFNKKITWDTTQTGICGNMNPSTLQKDIDELALILGEKGKDIIEVLTHSYQKDNLAKAHKQLIHTIIGYDDFLIIDGNDKTLKSCFTTVMKNEIANPLSKSLVETQNQKLISNQYNPQAFARDINLFYIDKANHKRERIELENNYYKILNTNYIYSNNEIINLIEKTPENFSPNVILRPLYQQTYLPSIAYVGGAGELSYWMQLPLLFEKYNTAFPMLIARNSALFLSKNLASKANKIGLSIEDLFDTALNIQKQYLSKNNPTISLNENTKIAIEQQYKQIHDTVTNIDKSLQSFVLAEKHKALQQLEGVFAKIDKSLKQQQNTQMIQIEQIKNTLFPNNNLQEREDSFIWLWYIFGKEYILNILNEKFEAMPKSIHIFEEI
jgi:bacillithiol biosynthesis cysteine-adding enzyme BshC